MMRALIQLLLVAACVLLSSCSLMGTRAVPVEDPTVPMAFTGYSLLPPGGDGWHVLGNNETGVAFAKGLDPLTHSQAAFVFGREDRSNFYSPELFLAQTKREFEESADSRRYRSLQDEWALDDTYGTHCVRYHWRVEDHGVPSLAKGEYMLLDAHGYSFIHPDIPNLIVRVEYSERREPGRPETALGQERDSFLRGISLEPGRLPMRYGEIGMHYLMSAAWGVPVGSVSGFGESGAFASRPTRDLYDPGLAIGFSIGLHTPTWLGEIDICFLPATSGHDEALI